MKLSGSRKSTVERAYSTLQCGMYMIRTARDEELIYVHDAEVANGRYICEDVTGATVVISMRIMEYMEPVKLGDFEAWRHVLQTMNCVNN